MQATVEEKKIKILTVDDEELNLDILSEYFEDAKFETILARDGLEALAALEADKDIDLVVLDRMMPNMDSISFLKQIKQEKKYHRLPVIMQTAATSTEQIKEGIEAGAYYYLSKPYQKEVLLSIVRAAANDYRKWNNMETKISANDNALDLLHYAVFQFYDLDEIKSLSSLIASCCPKEKNVLWGLTELLLNAVEHGNLGISYEQKKQMIIEGTWNDKIASMLQNTDNKAKIGKLEYLKTDSTIKITITDVGNGFNWKKYMDIDPERITDPNGRGIALARQISFDELVYVGKGNQAIATVYLYA